MAKATLTFSPFIIAKNLKDVGTPAYIAPQNEGYYIRHNPDVNARWCN